MARMTDIWPGIVCEVKRECKYGDDGFYSKISCQAKICGGGSISVVFALGIDRGQFYNPSPAATRRPLAAGSAVRVNAENTGPTQGNGARWWCLDCIIHVWP